MRSQRRRRKRIRLRRLRRLACAGVLLLTIITTFVVLKVTETKTKKPIVEKPIQVYPDPPGIIFHSSDSPAVWKGIPINAERLEQIHKRDHPDWRTEWEGKVYHIGYHYVILPDGTVEKGRPDHCKGCHAPHFNNWIGVCIIGAFDPSIPYYWYPSKPTAKQVEAVQQLCKDLMTKYKIPASRIIRHRDAKKTWCPGRRFPYDRIINNLTVFEQNNLQIVPAELPKLTDFQQGVLNGEIDRPK